ncbi:MAG: ribonuclease P protein component, partial [Rikenella sp.]|nr:ribonuclease P protein component [Rikenella sp.]
SMNDSSRPELSMGCGHMGEKGRYALSKTERLSKRSDIGRLFTDGEAFLVYPIKCTFRFREAGDGNRIMVIVPKRNHRRAVARNLLKRRMREAYRLNKHGLDPLPILSSAGETGTTSAGLDLAFSYVAKGTPVDYRTVEQAIISILKKLCAIRDQKTTGDGLATDNAAPLNGGR